jgi:hypothetical protein
MRLREPEGPVSKGKMGLVVRLLEMRWNHPGPLFC